MLVMGRMLPEILMPRDTLIFLLQHVGFVINLKKSVLHPVKQIRVSELRNRYQENYFGSFTEKAKMSQKCQEILTEPKTSVFYLTKLIGLLSSTAQAILPARIQLWYLQQEQILALQKKRSYSGHVILGNLARNSENLKLCNGSKLQQQDPIWSFRQMLQQKAGGILQVSTVSRHSSDPPPSLHSFF